MPLKADMILNYDTPLFLFFFFGTFFSGVVNLKQSVKFLSMRISCFLLNCEISQNHSTEGGIYTLRNKHL